MIVKIFKGTGPMKFNRVEHIWQAEKLVKELPSIISLDTEYVKGDPRTTQLLSTIVSDGVSSWSFSPSLLPALTATIKARKLIFLQDYNHCDSIILFHNGCDLRNTYCLNTIDLHHLVNENEDHDLGSRIFKAYQDNYKSEFWGKYKNYEDAPSDEALEYECKDAVYTYRLGLDDLNTLISKGGCDLIEHTRRTGQALLDTELFGLTVNTDLIVRTKSGMEKQLEKLLADMRQEFKDQCDTWELKKWVEEIDSFKTEARRAKVQRPRFNFSSSKQLPILLFDEKYLNLPILEQTPTGAPSTKYEVLKTLSETYPVLNTLVKFKEIESIYGTFVKGLLERTDSGKIYPHFNVSGTDTGRISHSNPNMGNLPTEGIIRNFFTAREGYSIIGADYAQLEVTIEANLTEDPELIKIVTQGANKHDITAEGLKIDRKLAKTLNFAMQYLCGEFKVGKLLGCCSCTQKEYYDGLRNGLSRDTCNCRGMAEACRVYDSFWGIYKGSKDKIEAVKKTLLKEGQVVNMFGRVRHFDCKGARLLNGRYVRQAYNFLIQGPAGDACNRAYWKFHEILKFSGKGRTLFSVHDEIVCEVKQEEAEWAKVVLVESMEEVSTFIKFKYPLKAKAYGPFNFWQKA